MTLSSVLRPLVPALLLSAAAVHAQDPAPSPSPVANVAAPMPAPTPKYVWSDVHISQPVVALTFDDGPHFALTPRLLDTLKEKGIWSHPNLAKMSDEAVRAELTQTQDAIQAAVGERPKLMRPPYGSYTKAQGKWFHDDLGFTVVLWDVDPDDWRAPGPSVVEDRVLNGWKDSTGVRPGSIVLSHDIHKGTVEAEPDIIDKLKAKGYKFVTVSELIALNEPEAPHTPRPDASPGKGKTARPAASPKPTVDPSLPKTINGTM